MTDLSALMKQAKAMQDNIKQAQEELIQLKVVGKAGGDMVIAGMNGRHFLERIRIDPSVFKEEDRSMLEDLICAAVNDAVSKVEDASRAKMSNMMNNVDLPAGMDLDSLLKGTGDD